MYLSPWSRLSVFRLFLVCSVDVAWLAGYSSVVIICGVLCWFGLMTATDYYYWYCNKWLNGWREGEAWKWCNWLQVEWGTWKSAALLLDKNGISEMEASVILVYVKKLSWYCPEDEKNRTYSGKRKKVLSLKKTPAYSSNWNMWLSILCIFKVQTKDHVSNFLKKLPFW